MRQACFLVLLLALIAVPSPAAAQRPMPGGQRPPIAPPPPAPANIQLPFQLLPGERTGRLVAVGAPGPIHIQVRADGGPVVVAVERPDHTQTEHKGSGSFVVDVTARAEEVARGLLWSVHVSPAAAPAGKGGAKPTAITGTLSLTCPPADEKQLQTEAGAVLQAVNAKRAEMRGAPADAATRNAALAAALQQRQQEANQQRAARNEQAIRSLAGKVGAEGVSRATTLLQSTGPANLRRRGNAGSGRNPRNVDTGNSAPDAPTPVLQSLSPDAGEPGTPVLLAGEHFGALEGEVHFLFGSRPEDDHLAVVAAWTDTQIFVLVDPTLSGYRSQTCQVFVVTGYAKRSTMLPFRFQPALDYQVLTQETPDRVLAAPFWIEQGEILHGHDMSSGWVAFAVSMLAGASGTDDFYRNLRLANDWVGADALLVHGRWENSKFVDVPGPSVSSPANAYVQDFQPGTPNPLVRVRWWYDAGNTGLQYQLRLVVCGPRGTTWK